MHFTRRRFLSALPALALTPRLARADAPLLIRVNIPGPHSTPFLPIELIQRLGLDREHGAELVVRHFPSGVQAMDDVLAGNAHFAGIALSAMAAMAAKGSDTIAIAPLSGSSTPYALVISKELRDRIRKPGDLKGRSIGVSVGSATTKTYLQTLAEIILSVHGVRADEVRWVGTAQNMDGQRGALGGKVVDAVFCEEPFVSGLVSEGIGQVLLDMSHPKIMKIVPGIGHLRAAVATTRRLMQQDPQRVERMVRMVQGALSWMSKAPPSQLVDRLAIENAAERRQFVGTLSRLPNLYSQDGRFSASQIAATRQFLQVSNQPGANLDLDSLVGDTWAGRKP